MTAYTDASADIPPPCSDGAHVLVAAVWASYQDSLIDEAGVVMQPSRQAQVESVEYSSIVRVPLRHRSDCAESARKLAL